LINHLVSHLESQKKQWSIIKSNFIALIDYAAGSSTGVYPGTNKQIKGLIRIIEK
jgi:hypothetical protein